MSRCPRGWCCHRGDSTVSVGASGAECRAAEETLRGASEDLAALLGGCRGRRGAAASDRPQREGRGPPRVPTAALRQRPPRVRRRGRWSPSLWSVCLADRCGRWLGGAATAYPPCHAAGFPSLAEVEVVAWKPRCRTAAGETTMVATWGVPAVARRGERLRRRAWSQVALCTFGLSPNEAGCGCLCVRTTWRTQTPPRKPSTQKP